MIKTNLTFPKYQQIKAVNASLLKQFLKSPRDAKQYLETETEPTPSMIKGSVLHSAILEPASLMTNVVVWDGIRRGKEWESFKDANAAKMILNVTEHQEISAMVEAVQQHELAAGILYGKGKNEVTITWKDKETGIDCKARLDRIKNPSHIVEVKTTHKVDKRTFENDCSKFGYWLQFAFYFDGLSVLRPSDEIFFSVVLVQNTAPYNVAVGSVMLPAIEHGRDQYQKAIKQYIECTGSDHWPGPYDNEMIELNVPAWDQNMDGLLKADFGGV